MLAVVMVTVTGPACAKTLQQPGKLILIWAYGQGIPRTPHIEVYVDVADEEFGHQ